MGIRHSGHSGRTSTDQEGNMPERRFSGLAIVKVRPRSTHRAHARLSNTPGFLVLDYAQGVLVVEWHETSPNQTTAERDVERKVVGALSVSTDQSRPSMVATMVLVATFGEPVQPA
jgi:hypothetical protein